MRKLLKQKFIFLPSLLLVLFFANLCASAQVTDYTQETGYTFEGGMTYEEYLETNPADTSYETFMKLNVGRSKNVIDCRNHCNQSCVDGGGVSTWEYYVTYHCWL